MPSATCRPSRRSPTACAATAVVMSVQNSIVCESLLPLRHAEAQKQRFLVPLAQGKTIGAFALTEPEAGSDPVSQSTTAVRDGDFYILDGTKRFITSGKNAGLTMLVTAKTDEASDTRGISRLHRAQEAPPASTSGPRREDGVAGLGHHRLDFRGLPGAGGPPPGRRRPRVRDRHAGPGQRPHRHRGPERRAWPRRPWTRRSSTPGSARSSARASPSSRGCAGWWPTWPWRWPRRGS